VHLGRPPAEPGGPVNPSVVLSSTYHQGAERIYGREGNPVFDALETAVGGLEGGGAVSYSSGMAAVAAVVEMLPVPGRVVVAADAYNGTRALLSDLAGRGRLRVRLVDLADTTAALEACAEVSGSPGRPSGREGDFGSGGLLWVESPSNPLLAVADLPALVAGAHSLGFDVAVDNTFATPILQQPLRAGADVVVHSATNALGGHSDVLLGVVVTSRPGLVEGLRRRRSLHGAVPGPWEAWLVLRGIRTLSLRVERSQANAGELARRLSDHPGVERVHYPGLPNDPGHDRMTRQMAGPGFMVSFVVHRAGQDAAETAEAVTAGVGLATAATSLGGVETLIERRGRIPGEEHLPPGLLRCSVGVEDVEDLWADLDGAIRGAIGG
jgi:cystathionine gamma-synthase